MAGCNTTRMRPHDRASEQTVPLAQKSPARSGSATSFAAIESSATTPSAGCVGATDPIGFLGWRRVCPRRYLHRGGSGPIKGGECHPGDPAWMVPIVSPTIWNHAARRSDEDRVRFKARASRLPTDFSVTLPAVVMPRAFRALAICCSDVAPACRISWITGSTLAAEASASAAVSPCRRQWTA
jgi:hypothetical protein